jgi:hypothetical protein
MTVIVPESWNKPWPFGVFVFGVFLLVPAVFGTITGKLYGKGGMVDRAKSPVGFWVALVVNYLCGAGLILYWVYVLPH